MSSTVTFQNELEATYKALNVLELAIWNAPADDWRADLAWETIQECLNAFCGLRALQLENRPANVKPRSESMGLPELLDKEVADPFFLNR
jgi:hypothetical protein